LYEAQGAPARAYKIYDELMPKSQEDMMRPRWYQSQVMASMNKLVEKHPELAPTNAPVTATTAQPDLGAIIKQALAQKAATSAPTVLSATNAGPDKK
jgi:hypothetical protein